MGAKGSRLRVHSSRPTWAGLDWIDGARTGFFSMLVGGFFAYQDVKTPDFLETSLDWSITISLLLGGWLLIQLSRLWARWHAFRGALETSPSARNAGTWHSIRRGFREQFVALAISLLVLSVLAWSARTSSFAPWPEARVPANLPGGNFSMQSLVALLALMLCFMPVILAGYLKAKYDTRCRDDGLFRSDAVSTSTAYVTGTFVLAITLLAIWAGNQHSEISSTLAFYVTFGVMLMFVVFILWPHVARTLNGFFERKELQKNPVASAGVPSTLPATALSYLDSFLVRLVAPMSGATQSGPMVPHTFVLLILLPLIAIGFFLPSPYGLVPVFMGIVIVLALGRRWAWIEDDRETASRLLQTDSDEIHIGFDNDLKDEALLGYATLFLFVPLALYQIHGWLPGVFVPGEGNANDPIRDWVGFFGSELAKAVPFVDWWEIYQIDIDQPFEPAAELPLGKHLTFLARAMVDLVIMAALFQALSIWQRGRTQNRLYNAGQLDAFDPFTEHEFFTHGMLKVGQHYRPRNKFERRVQDHIDCRSRLGLPPTPYNERRLSEIVRIGAEDPRQLEVVAAADWMIKTFNVLAGSPEQKLGQLIEQWEQDLENGAGAREHFGFPEQQEWRRAEKLRLETLLNEIRDSENEVVPTRLSKQDVINLLLLAKLCDSADEFHFARVLILEILGQSSNKSAFWALAAQAGSTTFLEEHPRYSELLDAALGSPYRARLGKQEMRALVYEAISEHVRSSDYIVSEVHLIIEFLETVSGSEAQSAGTAATDAANELRKLVCRNPELFGA